MRFSNPIARLLTHVGMKPFLRSCPASKPHRWEILYAAERRYVGSRFICRDCPRRIDEIPGGSPYFDPTLDAVERLQKGHPVRDELPKVRFWDARRTGGTHG